MKDCIFCKIAKGEIPTKFVYQDKEVVAFPDIEPLAPVHILIVPRRHLEGIQKIKQGDQLLLGKMLLVARKVAEKKKLQGYKLFFNCGKLGGQGVFHLHLHLIGGWKNQKEFSQLLKKRIEEGGVL